MIDLHCHVLPGIDDGPASIEGSVEMARAAAAGGTSTMVATPHVSWDMPNDAPTIARLVDEVNDRFAREGIAVTVRCGAEVAITRAMDMGADELVEFSLGSGPWVLVEPPFSSLTPGLEGLFGRLHSGRQRVVIAHPERCPAFRREPEALGRLVAGGALTSITAGSLSGRFGGEIRRFAHDMVERDLVHNVASDAHDAVSRSPSLAEEIHRSGFGWLADWAADAVPAAILAGEAIPPRPARPAQPAGGKRRWWRRGR